ncbi:uncharacterized protein J3D65DRAFT_603609 [Phyllosticta citribraziliensis]|uniref:Uncharacterized protein n=1 Tax=Phyllosticta citribraziliensis TaxID=989973 RepID=A0ABR1LM73_9PEZI
MVYWDVINPKESMWTFIDLLLGKASNTHLLWDIRWEAYEDTIEELYWLATMWKPHVNKDTDKKDHINECVHGARMPGSWEERYDRMTEAFYELVEEKKREEEEAERRAAFTGEDTVVISDDPFLWCCGISKIDAKVLRADLDTAERMDDFKNPGSSLQVLTTLYDVSSVGIDTDSACATAPHQFAAHRPSCAVRTVSLEVLIPVNNAEIPEASHAIQKITVARRRGPAARQLQPSRRMLLGRPRS